MSDTENCLGCYQKLQSERYSGEYHERCSKKLFGMLKPPTIEFGVEEIEELAKQSLSQHLAITGVQPKISLNLQKDGERLSRLTIVGFLGEFILKPPSLSFPDMAVVEDLSMHLAQLTKIKTAQHGLVRFRSGQFAYIARRFDRIRHRKKLVKIAVEDFCQLSGLLTEQKYKTSMEKAGKIILRYSSNPGLDLSGFFDVTLFSFLIGNADMYLKNFSLLTNEAGEVGLSPAYDLLSTRLMPIDDSEEMALTVHGKKSRLTRNDFVAMARSLNIADKVIENSFSRLASAVAEMPTLIQQSFLPDTLKTDFVELIHQRAGILGLRR